MLMNNDILLNSDGNMMMILIIMMMKICDEGAISTGEGDGGVAEREETARRGKPCEYNTGEQMDDDGDDQRDGDGGDNNCV